VKTVRRSKRIFESRRERQKCPGFAGVLERKSADETAWPSASPRIGREDKIGGKKRFGKGDYRGKGIAAIFCTRRFLCSAVWVRISLRVFS